MLEFLDSHIAYWHWLVLGLILCAVEIFIPSFVVIWFGVSALFVGVIALVTDLSFTLQLLIWVLLSVSDLVVWLKFVQPRLKNKSLSGMSREALLGQQGTVLEVNPDRGRGRMRFSVPVLGSDEWQFICDEALSSGDRVRVVELSGNTLVVTKA